MPRPAGEEFACAVLSMLLTSTKPVGASVIHACLLDQGRDVSEPTVARMLRDFDRRGLTKGEGRLGRRITAAGRTELLRLEVDTSRQRNARRFLDTLRAETLSDLINVIIARRGIEREIARSAALHATVDDLDALKARDRAMRNGAPSRGLHALLATAAHNPVLGPALELITHDPEVGERIAGILEERGKLVDFAFHEKVIQAIERRDPDAAEAAVLSHINEVLKIVRGAWAERSENESASPTRRRKRRRDPIRP